MKPELVHEEDSRLLVQSYSRPPIVLTQGEGVFLFDSEGKRYLDFAAGIAVLALGHSDPEWAQAVSEQAQELTHVSNLFLTTPQVELARRLVDHSFADRVFFSNSGSEANEAALKFARKYARQIGPAKTSVVAFQGSFHGRTLGALSMTHKSHFRDPFAPLVPGITFIPLNNLDAARAAITPEVCAVFLEPIQGEGGVHSADPEFLIGLRHLCDQQQALLVFDEIQCGLGRSGYLWAHEPSGVQPDIMTLAKPLAGGLPIGATLVMERVARAIQVGDHGSTFGGGPLVCKAATVVFDRVTEDPFLEEVRAKGRMLMEALVSLPSGHIVDVRGSGLLVGLEFDRPVRPLQQAALERGLILINAGEHVLRICPPLTISSEELNLGLSILKDCLADIEEGG